MSCYQEAGLAVVVPLAAEIDLVNCEQVSDKIYAAFVSGAAVVIADFTATSFCDCASLRRLLAVQQRATAQGAQLRLAIPPGSPVRRVEELLGLNGRLRIYPGMDEASGPAGSRSDPRESSRTGPGGAGSSVPNLSPAPPRRHSPSEVLRPSRDGKRTFQAVTTRGLV